MKGKAGKVEERLDVSSVFPFTFASKIYRFSCRYECLYEIQRSREVIGAGYRFFNARQLMNDCKKK